MDKQEFNNELVELQLLGQQVKELDHYINSIEQKIAEVDNSILSLKQFKDRENDQELLIPIVPGIFTKGKIIDKDKIMIGVGGNVVIESNLDHAIEILEKQEEELVKHRDDMLKELDALVKRMQELEEYLKSKKN